MKGEELLNAIEHIDADLIDAADVPVKKRNSMVGLVAALAAMLVLVISIAFMLGEYPGGPVQIGSQPGHSSGTPPFSSNDPSTVLPSWSHPPTQPSNVYPPQQVPLYHPLSRNQKFLHICPPIPFRCAIS